MFRLAPPASNPWSMAPRARAVSPSEAAVDSSSQKTAIRACPLCRKGEGDQAGQGADVAAFGAFLAGLGHLVRQQGARAGPPLDGGQTGSNDWRGRKRSDRSWRPPLAPERPPV